MGLFRKVGAMAAGPLPPASTSAPPGPHRPAAAAAAPPGLMGRQPAANGPDAQAAPHRRGAALDLLQRASADWNQAAPQRRPTLAQLAREEDTRNAAEQAQRAGGLAASPPSQAATLSADEQRWLAQALPGEGRAGQRLADRAARARLAVATGVRAGLARRFGPGAPRPLTGQRLEDFRDRVRHDVAALAVHAGLEPPAAAALLLRAVESGALGAGHHPDDRLLLLSTLRRWSDPAPPRAADVPWAPQAMQDWWPSLPKAHQDTIEDALEGAQDDIGTTLLAGARDGSAPAMQALHDHLFEHYRLENDGQLHRIRDTDTGRARNHIGVMAPPAGAATGPSSAVDPRDAALQARLEQIYAANDAAKQQHRFLHGGPRPPS